MDRYARQNQIIGWWNAYVTGHLAPLLANRYDDPAVLRLAWVRWLIETRHTWCDGLCDCQRGPRPCPYERLPLPPSFEAA